MGVRALVAALVFVVVGMVAFTVAVLREGPPGDGDTSTVSVSQAMDGTSQMEPDPDLVITFHPGMPPATISEFGAGLHDYINGFAAASADYERERLLMKWDARTSEELRRAVVLVLESNFHVASVSRVR